MLQEVLAGEYLGNIMREISEGEPEGLGDNGVTDEYLVHLANTVHKLGRGTSL